ncbi:ATP-dependent DNA helicase [Lentinula edodes]|uniref:DNA 3'-5' helicase n=1 Tax=Lentinula edodes TaxID=5353 RepID=A0A1Q3E1E7_LENED|nr:ATP-dependent DNA helicase [Lentinula edodes]
MSSTSSGPLYEEICGADLSNHEWRTSPTVGVIQELKIRIENCHRILRTTFGHSDYKGKQKEIIEAAVAGRDVFVLAPTGMGKASLMKNQIEGLRRKSVPVASLTSDTPPDEKEEINQALMSGHPKIRLLYTTPEKLPRPDFMKLLRIVYNKGELNRLVVDEVCFIVALEHSMTHSVLYRHIAYPGEYRRIGIFRQNFPDVPVMALTATATPSVVDDIISSLQMKGCDLFVHPFNRPNLYYEVRYTSSSDELSKMAEICDYICGLHRKRGKVSCGIIYCRTKKTCDSLSGYLRSKGLASRPYHRGVAKGTLAKTFEEWSIPGGSESGGIDVVVATVAFGLGIDKGDVRYVIHYDIPKSFEGYYQETGRAGRNGVPSKCILYYSREDLSEVRRWVTDSHSSRVQKAEDLRFPAPSQRSISSLEKLAQYAENTDVCRHISICRFFGEDIDDKDSEIVKQYCKMMCDQTSSLSKPFKAPSMNGRGSLAIAAPMKVISSSSSRSSEQCQPQNGPPSRGAKNGEARLELEKDSIFGAELGSDSSVTSSQDMAKNSDAIPDLVLPDVHIEIEDPSSGKVPVTIRRTAVGAIRKTIHRVFTRREELWGRLKKIPNIDTRGSIIASVATEIEYSSIFCFSSTPEGYRVRLKNKECFEDAREAIKIITRLSSGILLFCGLFCGLYSNIALARQEAFGTPAINLEAKACCTALSSLLPGQVFWPSSDSYRAQQSSYYSGEQATMTPACRVSPNNASDVSRILKFASAHECHFAVRTGGHMAWSGASNIGSEGFTIDMQQVKGVPTLSADKSVVSFGAGSRWRDVYTVLQLQNLTTVGGRVGDVGVGGFLLGGGIGFLSAEHGFGSDNIQNYEVVLVNGSIINANQKQHSSLYWGLKLGSTNFGVVTRFDMFTFSQGPVWGGSQFFAIKDAPNLLERLVTFTEKLAEDPKGFFGLSLAWNPEAKDYIIWTLQTYLKPEAYPALWSGFESLTPLVDMMGIKNLTDITEEFQEADPGKHGRSRWLTMTYKANAQFHLDLYARGVELFEPYHGHAGVHWAVSVQPVPARLASAGIENGGNPTCLKESEGNLWVMLITTDWLDPSDDHIMNTSAEALLRWAEDEAKRRGLFSPFIYMNYASGSEAVMVRSTDGQTLKKMIQVKKMYDPQGDLDKLWHGGFKLPQTEEHGPVTNYDRSEL